MNFQKMVGIAALAGVVVLPGCGGGGSDNASTSTTTTPVTTSPVTTTPVTTTPVTTAPVTTPPVTTPPVTNPPVIITPGPDNPTIYFSGLPASVSIRGLMMGPSGRLVAVSDTGSVLQSINGTEWTAPVSGTLLAGDGVRTARFVGDRFFALGDNASSSTDGITWTTAVRQSNWPYPLWAIAYRPASAGVTPLYVASGTAGDITSGALLKSTDGINWTPIIVPSMQSAIWSSIAYGNGRFVAGSQDGFAATSTDGTTWVLGASSVTGGPALRQAAFSSSTGKFVMGANGGTMYSSTDGLSWTAQASGTSSNIMALTCEGTLCVAATSGFVPTLLYSTNLGPWTAAFPAATGYGKTSFVFSIVKTGSKWVAAGSDGLLLESPNGQAWTVTASR